MKKILVVGAGFAGAVLARHLADNSDFRIIVIERRPHVAGNCHTERDPETGIMVHKYGAHIFHTSNSVIWEYIQRFGAFMPFINRPKAVTEMGVYSLPVNLHTINQFFGTKFNPAEAARFLTSKTDASIKEPGNFEEQALKYMGSELYQAFFYGYTKKHWGCEPKTLPTSILKRIPLRFNYNDNYYNSLYQGIPMDGYTKIVERILDHERIEVILNQAWTPDMHKEFYHVFYSGSLDGFYAYSYGPLKYRTLRWDIDRTQGDALGHPALNFPGMDVPYTRMREHKHYEYWKSFEKSIVFTEYPDEAVQDDELFYPKHLIDDSTRLDHYLRLSRKEKSITFIGRLGTYRYLDMHTVINESIYIASNWINTFYHTK